MSADRSATEEQIMSNVTGPFIGVEAAYRAERIRAEYGTKRHHPFRAVGRAISHLHKRVDNE
jgi:hypothetical protein